MMGLSFDIHKLLVLQTLCPRIFEIILLPTFHNKQQHIFAQPTGGSSNSTEESVSASSGSATLYPHLELFFFIEGTRKVHIQLYHYGI